MILVQKLIVVYLDTHQHLNEYPHARLTSSDNRKKLFLEIKKLLLIDKLLLGCCWTSTFFRRRHPCHKNPQSQVSNNLNNNSVSTAKANITKGGIWQKLELYVWVFEFSEFGTEKSYGGALKQTLFYCQKNSNFSPTAPHQGERGSMQKVWIHQKRNQDF